MSLERNLIGTEVKHAIVNHREGEYVKDDAHTNTIEDFWSLLKWAWYGTHHHYSTGYTPLYVAETRYKYNYCDLEEGAIFWKFLREIFS